MANFSLADLQKKDREKMKILAQQEQVQGAQQPNASEISSQDLAKAQAVQQLVSTPSQSGGSGIVGSTAQGALTGASLGGAPGAAIGGGVGALKGILGARSAKKQRKRDAEVQKQRDMSNIASEKTVRVQSAIQEMARNLGLSLN